MDRGQLLAAHHLVFIITFCREILDEYFDGTVRDNILQGILSCVFIFNVHNHETIFDIVPLLYNVLRASPGHVVKCCWTL